MSRWSFFSERIWLCLLTITHRCSLHRVRDKCRVFCGGRFLLHGHDHGTDDNLLYELVGVCNHSGSLSGGHYTAYVRREKIDAHDCRASETTDTPKYEWCVKNPCSDCCCLPHSVDSFPIQQQQHPSDDTVSSSKKIYIYTYICRQVVLQRFICLTLDKRLRSDCAGLFALLPANVEPQDLSRTHCRQEPQFGCVHHRKQHQQHWRRYEGGGARDTKSAC